MVRLLRIAWADWKKRHFPATEELLHQRRNILFLRFALFGCSLAVIHTFIDGGQGFVGSALIDAGIAVVIFTAYLLAKLGKPMVGKILMLGFLNLALSAYCSVITKSHGIYLYFFPLIGLSFVVFDQRHRHFGVGFVVLSLCLLVALVVTDFKLLGDLAIPSYNEKSSFLINLTSSALILLFCINFLMKCNNDSEKRLMKLADEIGHKNSVLEKTNSELDRFVYSASHDLRAPLLSIQGIVSLAKRENSDPAIDEYFSMVSGQVVKLDSFIKDIISYSQNARMEVVEQPVDFNLVVEDVREKLRYMDGAEKIRWEKEIDDQLVWLSDKGRIGTVLTNLLSNAIKYHNYSRDDRWIKIGVRKDITHCCITIRDNGVGIPVEHQQKVFDMFYRAHDNSTGSGLGLYIVKEIVSKMNGSINLHSLPGQGSTFTIMLPVLAA